MARRECALALLGLLAAGSAWAVSRPADPLAEVKSAIRLKNFTAAAASLQRLAAAGNAEAEYLYGVFYLNGLAGPADPAVARTWLEKSAAQGNARAAFSLATLCSEATPPDTSCAEHWLARARTLGFRAPASVGAARAAPESLPASLSPAAQLKDPAVRREALWLAAADADLSALEVLADPGLARATDEFGRGALARSAEAGSAEAVTLLLRRGAPVDQADQYGMTPLMLAARAGAPAAVAALLAAHASVAAADRAGNTPLMHAAAGGRLDAVDLLLAAGAKVSVRNAEDWSALDFAQQRGAADVEARLREKGATALARHAVERESTPDSVQRAAHD
ncbi:MAG TPA: ankyrin repeat domain-containing protein, partial [Steroidobacteraceae bacterium]|nr:ankyrin repeat domain-containing protein [Steroidobacteraceae bacterium]